MKSSVSENSITVKRYVLVTQLLLTRVLKIFAIFTGKHLCWSLFSIKLPAKRDSTQMFSCEYCQNFKHTYFEEHPLRTASVYIMLLVYHPFLHRFLAPISYSRRFSGVFKGNKMGTLAARNGLISKDL